MHVPFVMTLTHFTSDRQCISFPSMYYVDSLVTRPQLISWLAIFLQQLCFALDCCCSILMGGHSSHLC